MARVAEFRSSTNWAHSLFLASSIEETNPNGCFRNLTGHERGRNPGGADPQVNRVLDRERITHEIIVIDGPSTDGSREVAQELGARVVEERRRGYAGAMVTGLAEARGDYVLGRIAASRSPFGDWRDPASRGFIIVVAVTLAWWTWASWGDIQIDCGSDLYVSAEILHGRLLYRDIFYPYGPLIPYVQALLLSFMGPHLVVFYLFGIGVAIGCALLLFEIGAMLEPRGAGLTAALALLFTGFSPGIFNYPFPYSYSATTGLMLSLLCAWFTIRHLFARRGYNLLIAGIGAGLAMLCKHEFGAACYLMLGFVLVMEAITRQSVLPLLHGIAACTPGMALWVAIYGWFFWKLTPALLIDGNWLGPGSHFSHTAAGAALVAFLGQRFVPREMVALIMRAALCLLLWFLLAKASRAQRNVVLAIMVAVAGAHRFAPLHLMTGKIRVFLSVAHGIFLVFPRGMFFIGCGFIAYAIYKLNQSADRRYLAEAAFGIFALVPAIRVFAEIAPHGYSIYYAMPLFLVFVIVISRSIKAATTTLPADRQRALVKHLLAAEIVMLALICIPPQRSVLPHSRRVGALSASIQKKPTSRDRCLPSSPSRSAAAGKSLCYLRRPSCMP